MYAFYLSIKNKKIKWPISLWRDTIIIYWWETISNSWERGTEIVDLQWWSFHFLMSFCQFMFHVFWSCDIRCTNIWYFLLIYVYHISYLCIYHHLTSSCLISFIIRKWFSLSMVMVFALNKTLSHINIAA